MAVAAAQSNFQEGAILNPVFNLLFGYLAVLKMSPLLPHPNLGSAIALLAIGDSGDFNSRSSYLALSTAQVVVSAGLPPFIRQITSIEGDLSNPS